ncbi:putative uncharacterized protein DDB_G0271982 [Amyelois transitella]|uniref:putative uncharacterized protein DDB_G0271982 n=1 Tax=Amyelois transitella TaxID=680683 RepID=UPI0029902845|nr:putative uncharacterized protein DDB_G0271982 [Amyelois transitella]
MAIVRDAPDPANPISYVATVAFFCCVSCVVLMFFRGFRARINVASQRSRDENVPVVCISGAYRANREEFIEYGRIAEPPKKISPSMVRLPLNNNTIKASKSTTDIREPDFVPVMLNKSTPDISFDPRGGKNNVPEVQLRHPEKSQKVLKKEEKERLKLEKKRQAEHKAREKAAQEQAKKERVRLEKEQAKAKANEKKGKKKVVAPQAPPLPKSPPPQTSTALPPQSSTASPPQASTVPAPPRQPYPTDTLKSDINRSSGPPPYSELAEPNKPDKANSSNVSFGKPIDNTPSSWDMVTQHRQQMSRPTSTIGGARKQVVMDLQYNFNKNVDDKDNSEA